MFPGGCWSAAAAVIGAGLALWRGWAMVKFGLQVLFTVMSVVAALEAGIDGTGKGAEKKAIAVGKVREIVDPLAPDWVNPILEPVVGFLIDQLVAWGNRGFFAHFGVLSSAELPSS